MKKNLILFAIILILTISAIVLLDVKTLWEMSLTQVEKLGYWGYLLFILIYNLSTLLLIPSSILTIKGGCFYGLYLGSILVFIAAILGAISAFWLGRYYCQDWVNKQFKKYPQLEKIDRAVASEGWKIVFLTRLCPLFPFNLLNYFFGITQISLKDYVIGSLGIIPGTVMYVYIGSLITDISDFNSDNYTANPEIQTSIWIMRFLGLIATVAMVIYTTNIVQKTLKENVLDQD